MDLPIVPCPTIYPRTGQSPERRTNGICGHTLVNLPPEIVWTANNNNVRVYGILSIYLIVCSFWLTAVAFKVVFLWLRLLCFTDVLTSTQNIDLKGKSQSEIILTFFTPPVGALIVAMISTFGIYFIASFLYVSQPHILSSRLSGLPHLA